jgi:hypothetical protein
MTSSDSQCAIILARLQQTPGQWVSMPELAHLSGSYNIHTRIDDLRHRQGYPNIENKIEYRPPGRKQFSFYCIPSPITDSQHNS